MSVETNPHNYTNMNLLFSQIKPAEKSVRPKVLGAKPKQAGKKGGGWGEGIFARLLPFPFRSAVFDKMSSSQTVKTH